MYDDPVYGYGSVQLNRVNGLDDVTKAHIPRNSTVAFFHNSEDIFFIKTSDASGMCDPVRAFRFEEIDVSELAPVVMTRAEYNKWKELLDHAEHIIQTAAAASGSENVSAGAES